MSAAQRFRINLKGPESSVGEYMLWEETMQGLIELMNGIIGNMDFIPQRTSDKTCEK